MAKAFPLLTVDSTGTLGENAPLMLHIRLAEMLDLARHIDDPARITELHNMRIAAKRLRYTMELFLPYVPGSSGKELGDLLSKTKKIQEMIGEIHDRDVRIPLLREFMHDQEGDRPEVRVGLLRLAEQERRDRDRLYTQLIGYWFEQRDHYVTRLLGLIAAIGREAIKGAGKPAEPPELVKTDAADAEKGDDNDANRGDQ